MYECYAYLRSLILIAFCTYLSAEQNKRVLENTYSEIEKIPFKAFSRDNIRNYYNRNYSSQKNWAMILVEIRDNLLFVNDKLITEDTLHNTKWLPGDEVHEAIITFYQLTQKRQLPNVLFLYTKLCYHLNSIDDAVSVPVLVGTNSSQYVNKNTISFIETCTLSRNFLAKQNQIFKNYDWESIYKETLSTYDLVPWNEKIHKVFWRGHLSDVFHRGLAESKRVFRTDISCENCTLTPRAIFHYLSQNHPDIADAYLTGAGFPDFIYDIYQGTGKINEILIDPSLFKPFVSICDHIAFQYQLVLDGIHCTNPGYAWRLLSDCCVLKADSDLFQWFYIALDSWKHYVPIQPDGSDLIDIFTYLEKHQDLAQSIALNGKDFAMQYLKPDDFLDFSVMVLNAYADKQNRL